MSKSNSDNLTGEKIQQLLSAVGSAPDEENSKIEVETLLHLGCGGGHNDYTFKKHFKVTGVDISENMLKLARKLNSEVTYYYGDMRDIKLTGCFDAVTILDSINSAMVV